MLTRPSVNGDPRQSYASISNRNICGAAGRWLQHHPLVLLSVIFIWIAATRIFYVVLHDPMLGYGNQFDGKKGLLHGVKFSPPPEELGGLTLTLENYQNERLITSDPRYFLRPGDSGGGVICNRGEEEVVVGIHSFSFPVDSTVNSASVGHNYQWLLSEIEKINGP